MAPTTLGIQARDVMQQDIVSLPIDATLAAAARTFEEYRIGGAPVIDNLGKVVGVLSASDLARFEAHEGPHGGERGTYYLAATFDDDAEAEDFSDMEHFNSEAREEARISELMTPRVVSVDPNASLERVCQVMLEERVHRVLVTEENALVGIVSSFDVVRALAQR